MSQEKINYKEFRESYAFERKGRGLKAVPKAKSSAQSKKPKPAKKQFTSADIRFKQDEQGNVSFYLPVELTNDNDGRTHHYSRHASRRKAYEQLLRSFGLIRKVSPDYPQKLTITRILGKGQKLFDHDSTTRGNFKEIVDSLKSCGWFADDSPKYLMDVRGLQDDTQRENGFQILIELKRSN